MVWGQRPRLRKRVAKAVFVLLVGVLVWTILPGYLGTLLSKQLPASALTTPTFVYLFGGIIVALQVAIALTQGMTVMVPLESAFYILVALYI